MATAQSAPDAARRSAAKKAAGASTASKRAAKKPQTRADSAVVSPFPAESPAPTAPSKAPKVADTEGKSRHKVVRDSFTIPKHEYAMLAELKQRAIRLQHPAKKSELLRAGVAALQAMSDAALLSALQAVPSLKTGRPKNSGKR